LNTAAGDGLLAEEKATRGREYHRKKMLLFLSRGKHLLRKSYHQEEGVCQGKDKKKKLFCRQPFFNLESVLDVD
jgi:hypothetical protein